MRISKFNRQLIEKVMNRQLVVSLGVFSLILAACSSGRQDAADSISAPANQASGPVELKDLGQAPRLTLINYQGEEMPLAQYYDKPTVINSWALWCPFCKEELNAFSRVQKEFEDQVTIIAIDRAESLETAKGFTDGQGITDDIVFLLDPDDSFYQAIGGFSMPETVFVDNTGTTRIHKRGPMKADEIRSKIMTLLEVE